MSAAAELRLDDGLAILTLARPNVRNACSAELLDDVRDALAAPELAEASALILTGAGECFCAGGDISVMRSALDGDVDAVMGAMIVVLQDIIARLRALPMPVVAAVEGHAVGAGMGLALAADLRVIGRSALMVPGYLALGASPDAGVSYFLTRALGGPKALSAFLLNRPFTAEMAVEHGLAEEVVPDGETLAAARVLARRVASLSPGSVLAVRRLVDAATTHDLTLHLQAEVREFQALWRGEDFQEGVSAFLERRKPRFGRTPGEPAETRR